MQKIMSDSPKLVDFAIALVGNIFNLLGNTKAVFTLNVNYIQLNYVSIYHTPFDFIQLWFYSHLRKFK